MKLQPSDGILVLEGVQQFASCQIPHLKQLAVSHSSWCCSVATVCNEAKHVGSEDKAVAVLGTVNSNTPQALDSMQQATDASHQVTETYTEQISASAMVLWPHGMQCDSFCQEPHTLSV